MSTPARNISIAVLYSNADQTFWEELERHVSLLTRMHPNVRIWTADDTQLGSVASAAIREELRRADITLLLLSADFAIEEVFDVETRALLDTYARERGNRRYIMPIIVKDFLWRDHFDDHYDIEKLTFVDKIIRDPGNREPVYSEITEMLNNYIKEINARAIEFVIPTWVGYIGGILYNNGFVRSQTTELYQKYKRTLRFTLNDSTAEMVQLWKNGEADLIWATLDRLPAVLHQLRDYHPRVIFQASWSDGADCIIARNGITTVKDLKGKKISYPFDSPAFTFLRYVLDNEGLDPFDIVHQPQRQGDLNEVTRQFIDDKTIDAVVLWSPYAEVCLTEVPEARIISHTGTFPNLIADVVVAGENYISLNREELRELFNGWLRVTQELEADAEHREKALNVLVEAIIRPLPAIIPSSIRGSLTDSLRHYFNTSLDKVHLCSLEDNQHFFGLDGQPAKGGELYNHFLKLQYPEFLTDTALQWETVVDTAFIRSLGENVTLNSK